MKTVLATAALALAVGLGMTMLSAAPASAAGCIRQAALDLNADGWIDTAEFHMATDAGFQNVRSPGKQYLSEEDMNRCLQGSPAAFSWLESANPRYVAFMGPAPMPTYASAAGSRYPNPSRYYSAYDSGAAYDTPTPQAHAAALDYLRSKVYGNPAYDATAAGRSVPSYQPQGQVYTAVPPPMPQAYASNIAPMPQAQAPTYSYQPAPAAAPSYPSLSLEFSQMDANHDGVVSRDEYLDYMFSKGRSY